MAGDALGYLSPRPTERSVGWSTAGREPPRTERSVRARAARFKELMKASALDGRRPFWSPPGLADDRPP
jgi:hypothetical protein